MKSIVIGFDGIPLSPLQPLSAREIAGAAAPEAGPPPTPIIAGEQQVTSRVNIPFLG